MASDFDHNAAWAEGNPQVRIAVCTLCQLYRGCSLVPLLSLSMFNTPVHLVYVLGNLVEAAA